MGILNICIRMDIVDIIRHVLVMVMRQSKNMAYFEEE